MILIIKEIIATIALNLCKILLIIQKVLMIDKIERKLWLSQALMSRMLIQLHPRKEGSSHTQTSKSQLPLTTLLNTWLIEEKTKIPINNLLLTTTLVPQLTNTSLVMLQKILIFQTWSLKLWQDLHLQVAIPWHMDSRNSSNILLLTNQMKILAQMRVKEKTKVIQESKVSKIMKILITINLHLLELKTSELS